MLSNDKYKSRTSPLDTHQVENQSSPLVDFNRFESDGILQTILANYKTEWATTELSNFGEILGNAETIHQGFLANSEPPTLHTHDRQGHRIDFVEYHPTYHELYRLSIQQGLHSMPWSAPQDGAHVARAAGLYLAYQNEPGHICPTTMTYGSVPALKKEKIIADQWLPKVYSREYDPSFLPISKKTGATIGMAMTEKQGGSDVRTNQTTAAPIGAAGPGQEYRLNGHKWFCSAPMSDAFLVLANTPKGPSCFFVPRWLPDETKNNFFIQRLKNKLGDRSNASSEIELKNTWGRLIGEEGRGVATIIEMANYTRLDCTIASAGLMRFGVAEAINHCLDREAFGAKLIEQPIMQKVLADLAIEVEASLRLAMRLAAAYDSQNDENETRFRRISTAIAKYWNTKRSVPHVYECMEVLGGNGYVEESHFPRMLRQAPVNSIWEGSGNVMCLDVLRAMQKDSKTVEVLFDELSKSSCKNSNFDKLFNTVQSVLRSPDQVLSEARWLVEKVALLLQGTLMLEHSSEESARVFCDNRLSHEGPNTFGALRGEADWMQIISSASPRN